MNLWERRKKRARPTRSAAGIRPVRPRRRLIHQTCSEMKNSKKQNRRGRADADPPEMKAVGIDFNPAPDAEERLCRLFTILLKLAGDELPLPGMDSTREDGGAKD